MVSILYKNDIIDEDLIVADFHDVVEDIEHTGVTETIKERIWRKSNISCNVYNRKINQNLA